MADPKDQGMTAQEAAGRFCSWCVSVWAVSNDPLERAQAFWDAPPQLSEMLRHETQDQSDDYAPVPLWATGRRVPVDPNRPPELLSTDMWRYLDLDIEGNQAAGGGLEYVDLRIYDAEPQADDATPPGDQLQRAAEPHESSIAAPGGRAEATAARADCTVAAETRCKNWLIEMMSKGVPPDHTKSEYRADAKKRFSVGARAFDRAWQNACTETGNIAWSKPGRKS